MKIIGLTGGIASGKSTVSKMLNNLGAVIIDADKIARIIVEPGQQALKRIEEEFGKDILNSDGTLNRKALGSIVFNDPCKLGILNSITHPEIKKEILEHIENIKKDKRDNVIIIDAAVLIESGMDGLVEEVWLVYVNYDIQVKRLMERDGITEKEACARIKSQMPIKEKIKHCDKIIDNTKDILCTEKQVKEIWNDITK